MPWEDDLIQRAHGLRLEIDGIDKILGQPSVHASTADARQLLDELETEILEGEQVSIALLGGTGSGKSTLLNALLDARIVPTSSMKACTSVITKARWADDQRYTARVNFVPRESWERQVGHLTTDIAAHRSEGDDDTSHATEAASISKDDLDRLRAVYGEGVDRKSTV